MSSEKQPLLNCQLSLAVEAIAGSPLVSQLPHFKDLDGLDMRFLAPAGGLVFGHCSASLPFGVAERHDALGPELARRVRGEVDHDAMRVDTPRAATLVHLAVSIGRPELDAHDSPSWSEPAALTRKGVAVS
jgi:hypothetical protein